MIRVLLADDHVLMREGLKQLLSFSDDIVVSGEAITGEEVLQKLQQDSYDIVLLDVTMPGLHGATLIARIREQAHNPPVLVLSMHGEPQIAKCQVAAGAAGYLTKNSPPGMLEEAIRKVAAGGRYILPELAEKMIFLAPDTAALAAHARLSTQELRILKLLAQGLRVVDIAHELDLNSRTVSTHKTRLMQKLEIDNDAALIRYADANKLS